MNTEKVKIMAPAGSFASLQAALDNGADAVYFGVGKLNMRSHGAVNFKKQDLEKIVKKCTDKNVKTYLAINSIMYDNEIQEMKELCDKAKKNNITAIIASDMSVINYCKKIGMTCHISTQVNISNFEAVKFFAQYSDMIVIARELTLEQIKYINEQIKKENICGTSGKLLQIEVFIHGALCVSISGKCYMSLATQNSSANRGACFQPCRREYIVKNKETGTELEIDNQYIMSPKDLCTIGMLNKLIDSGVSVLKIEGRGRSPDYVAKVVSVYKEAVNSVYDKKYTKEKIQKWYEELKSVYNRGFWENGYYLGKKAGEWSGKYGSQSTKVNQYIGFVSNYFSKKGVAEFKLESNDIDLKSDLLFIGPTTGALNSKIDSLYVDGQKANNATKGDLVTIPVPKRVRKNDKVYKVVERDKYQ